MKKLIIVLGILFFALSAFAQEPEVVSKRTENTKVFDLGKGKLRYEIYSAPIHYQDEAKVWQVIDISLVETPTDFRNEKNKIKSYFPKDISVKEYATLKSDDTHYLSFGLDSLLIDGKEEKGIAFASLVMSPKAKTSRGISAKVSLECDVQRDGFLSFIKVNSPISSFKQVEEITLVGLHCSNIFVIDEYFDDKGRFYFADEKGEIKFFIKPPYLIDNEGKRSGQIKQRLVVRNGKLYYEKEITDNAFLSSLSYPILVDTTTYWSSTADGHISITNSEGWDASHDATTGTADSDDPYKDVAMTCRHFGLPGKYQIYRSFFYFDTSAIGGDTVDSADLYIYRYSAHGSGVSMQLGTQGDTLGNDDFNNFSGTYYGYTETWADPDAYNVIAFSAPDNQLVKDGTTKICCREYQHDYLDVDPDPDQTFYSGCYYTEQADTTYDPKIVAETSTPSAHSGWIQKGVWR